MKSWSLEYFFLQQSTAHYFKLFINLSIFSSSKVISDDICTFSKDIVQLNAHNSRTVLDCITYFFSSVDISILSLKNYILLFLHHRHSQQLIFLKLFISSFLTVYHNITHHYLIKDVRTRLLGSLSKGAQSWCYQIHEGIIAYKSY